MHYFYVGYIALAINNIYIWKIFHPFVCCDGYNGYLSNEQSKLEISESKWRSMAHNEHKIYEMMTSWSANNVIVIYDYIKYYRIREMQ